MPVAQTRLETLQICKLLQCVREKDMEQIEKLTINGVPHLVNYNEPNDGETAMNIAAIANNDPMIEFLCELGGHPDVVDFKGRSAAMRAAEYGHVQCLEKLVKRGANLKLIDVEGKGILFYCISPTQRHRKCTNIVLAYGADVNNISKDGEPVFQFACETAIENEELCLKSLQKGADPNSRSAKTNRTALMSACTSGSVKVVHALLERGVDVNQLMLRTKVHAAHEAAKGGFLDVLMALAAHEANFDQVDDQGNTPIHLAAMNGHTLCCKFLSQRGCNPKPKNKEGLAAKVIAKELGHKDTAKELRKAEKAFAKTAKAGDIVTTHMYDFCTERSAQLLDTFQKLDVDLVGIINSDEFVEVLKNSGAPMPEGDELRRIVRVNERERNFVDYNEFLTGKKYINKANLLSAFEGKKKKGKGGKRGRKGKTKIPMPICTQADGPRAIDGGPPDVFIPKHINFTDVARFDRDRPPKNPLHDDSDWYLDSPEKSYVNINDAVRQGDMYSLNDVLEMNGHVDVRDKYFKTPLMVACAYSNIKIASYLIKHGASVNSEDSFKWTPLHFACHAGSKDIVELLLDKGAHLEAVTVNGATPIMRAIESSRLEVVQYLINKGAKLQIENKKGNNPVDIATAWADLRVYDVIKTKWDSLPIPKEKKGVKGVKSAKRPKSEAGEATKDIGRTPRAEGQESPLLDLLPRQRKGSILRAASALAGGIDDREDITYMLTKTWTKQPNTEELMHERVLRRERFGWEVDFEDFSMPCMKNVYTKVAGEGGLSDTD